jgi:gamma-glutamyl:cysteine ligase YbdK (ATP-grasp superfamily)
LPAVSASSPFVEGRIGQDVDNRLKFYVANQGEVPSIAGRVVPEYVTSFSQYQKDVIEEYSEDLVKAGASRCLLNKDWVNSRGVIFRFDRRALEIRAMDEQECVKSDVALSCFTRSLLRGLIEEKEVLPFEVLVADYDAIVKKGLNAAVLSPHGKTARDVCRYLLKKAWENATESEQKYLPIVQKRIEGENLSEIIREKVLRKAQKTNLREAIVSVYSKLTKSLIDNQPYF